MANKIGMEIWACLILRREEAHHFQATGIWASCDQDSATLNLQSMMQRWFKLSAVVRASRLWWLWYPQADVLMWSHCGCFSKFQLAFLGSSLFSEPPSPALPSICELWHYPNSVQFPFLVPKNLTDTTLYLRNQTRATKVFHLDFCNSLRAFWTTVPSACNILFAPILMTYFHTSSGLCSNLTAHQGDFLSAPSIKQHPTLYSLSVPFYSLSAFFLVFIYIYPR